MAAGKYVNEEPYEVSLDIHGMIGGPRHARGMVMAKVRCISSYVVTLRSALPVLKVMLLIVF